LTPQIAGGWCEDDDLWARVYPMDLRPQAHDIIRTWLFSTLARAERLDGSLPWAQVAISGWIIDPDRKKMSKSIGNVVTPSALLDEYGSDAMRYWAASGRPGVDTAFDTNRMKVGRRLAMKILNAGRFVLAFEEPSPPATITDPLDRAMLAALDAVVADATAALEALDYTRALEAVEAFFWTFCNDYIELVKGRAYGSPASASAGELCVGDLAADDLTADDLAADSARLAMRQALDTLLRLFAPVLPFVTEEVWSWFAEGSIHRSAWPTSSGEAQPPLWIAASTLIGALRRAKATAGLSMRTECAQLTLPVGASLLPVAPILLGDLRAAAHADEIVFVAE
jgi:valyl-tRNA synthetase